MALTTCQENGLFKIQFSKLHIAIMGPAGTGKTYLLRQFLDDVMDTHRVSLDSIAFCAPTHAAKKVLQETINSGRDEFSKIKAHTIHALLRIHPDTYEDEVIFDPKGEIPDLSHIKYMVIDEISMLDGILTNKVMEAANKYKFRIIGLGDPYQIQPVNPDGCYLHPTLGRISPIFFNKQFDRVILEEIVRQSSDNPIIKVATKIRKQNSDIFECIGDDGVTGVFKVNTDEELVEKYLKHVKKPEDMLNYKLMAFTNRKVDEMNDLVRKRLFNTDSAFVTGEYIVTQEPVMLRTKAFDSVIYNNGETIEIIEIEDGGEIDQEFSIDGLVYSKFIDSEDDDDIGHYDHDYEEPPVKLKVWKLKTRSVDSEDDDDFTFYVIKDPESKEKLSEYLSIAAGVFKERGAEIDASIKKIKKGIAMSADQKFKHECNAKISSLREERKLMWKDYWCLKGMFVDVKGAAACTLHKSQGATFDGVFISTDKLDYAEYHLARQLKYVAVTRARKFVYYS